MVISVPFFIASCGGGGGGGGDGDSRTITYTLTWDKPTLYEDGSVILASEYKFYRIYSKFEPDEEYYDYMDIDAQVYSTSYSGSINAIMPTADTFYLAISLITSNGAESRMSELVKVE